MLIISVIVFVMTSLGHYQTLKWKELAKSLGNVADLNEKINFHRNSEVQGKGMGTWEEKETTVLSKLYAEEEIIVHVNHIGYLFIQQSYSLK